MSEYIDKSEAVGEGYLQDWYISSVVGDVEPVWTEDHIEELAKDFIVIPKDTPAADVAPVVHGRWILERDPAGKKLPSEQTMMIYGTNPKATSPLNTLTSLPQSPQGLNSSTVNLRLDRLTRLL